MDERQLKFVDILKDIIRKDPETRTELEQSLIDLTTNKGTLYGNPGYFVERFIARETNVFIGEDGSIVSIERKI